MGKRMKDEDLEKEIEKRKLLSSIKSAATDAVCGGYITTKDILAILTEFIVQGYIVTNGDDKESKSLFNNAMDESWNACIKDYKKAKKQMDSDSEDFDSGKEIIRALI